MTAFPIFASLIEDLYTFGCRFKLNVENWYCSQLGMSYRGRLEIKEGVHDLKIKELYKAIWNNVKKDSKSRQTVFCIRK